MMNNQRATRTLSLSRSLPCHPRWDLREIRTRKPKAETKADGRLQGCVHSLSRCFGALFEQEKKCVAGNSSGEARGTHRRPQYKTHEETLSRANKLAWDIIFMKCTTTTRPTTTQLFLSLSLSVSSFSFEKICTLLNIYPFLHEDKTFIGMRE